MKNLLQLLLIIIGFAVFVLVVMQIQDSLKVSEKRRRSPSRQSRPGQARQSIVGGFCFSAAIVASHLPEIRIVIEFEFG